MSRKKRLLRAGCITLLLLAFIGYFTFSTLLFSPLEGRFKADIAGLIPRDVDVYVARAELGSAFRRFPRLAIEDDVADNAAVRTFFDSPEWAELDQQNRISEQLAELEAELAKVPLGLDVFDVAGGEDLAVAADFAGRRAEDSDWAVYTRVSFWGKAAVSMLRYPGVLGLSNRGIQVASANGVVTLSGRGLQKPIHITRINDVVVAGVSKRLVEAAVELEQSRSENSLLLAAPYNDSILSVDRDERERDFEVQIDIAGMRQKWGMTKPLLDPKSQRFAPAFLARLLPVDAVRRVLGVIDFDEGLDIDLTGNLSSENMTAGQERVLRAKGFDHDEVYEVARYAPEDSTLFVYVRGPISTIVQMFYDSLEPAAQANLLDVLRKLDFSSAQDFIEYLDEATADRLAFIARPNDWGYETDMEPDPETGEMVYMGPPNDGQPVFAWAVIAWVSDEAKIIDLREMIAGVGPEIGMQGRKQGDRGYYSKPIGGGLSVKEFWSPFIPGTGHIASLVYDDNILISNRYALIDAMVTNSVSRGSNVPRLSDRADFQALLNDSLPSADLLAWMDPGSGADLISEQLQGGARNRITSAIDYRTKRAEVERDVLQRVFEGRSRDRLTADDAQRLDGIVDDQLRAYTDEVVEQNLPREIQKASRLATYLRAVSAGLTMIRFTERQFELSSRFVTPYSSN